MNKNDNKDPKKQKKSILASLRLPFFSSQTTMSVFEEEQVQSPMKTVVNTFKSNKISMIALSVFVGFFLLMTIGPFLKPIDLSFSDSSQANVAPSRDMLSLPKELQNNTKTIGVGPTFSVGVSKQDDIYVWGRGQVTRAISMKEIPDIEWGTIKDISVGDDHVILVNEDNEIFGWGSDRRGQLTVPHYVAGNGEIKRVYAGYQCSIILSEDGYTTFFGNLMMNDYNDFHPYQGQVEDIIITVDSFAALLKDGSVVPLGVLENSFRNIPENMGTVVGIASTANTMAALNEEGDLFIWGNISPNRGEGLIPEHEGKIVLIEGGRNHYVAVTDQNEVLAWGRNLYGESSVPRKISQSNKDIAELYVGSYQNYVVYSDGTVEPFGHKGYIMGTDELGRDLFTRIINGGRLTMTIGAIAVVISTTIATILGGLSGYFGGRIDNVIQRIGEMTSALPFLPFAMILSALIGNKLTNEQRVFMLMIILGVLSWPGLMRLVRAQVLSAREQEYVVAAKALGINEFTIVFRHIIPNVISVIIVSATLSFGGSMLTESALSFLGFGVQAPQPTWGNILNGARSSQVIQDFWWRWVFASVALSICVISVNLIGEGLRDAIDPKSQER